MPFERDKEWWLNKARNEGDAAISAGPIQAWQCETCGAVYAEYVNGCPKCWHGDGTRPEPEVRSKVSLVAQREYYAPESEQPPSWSAPAQSQQKSRHKKSQKEIDISNLRFYAEMARKHEWQTEVIHWGVVEQTLQEIANRLEAKRPR